ncbi:MAG: hypothetical protein ABJ239_04120 [Erythrobacter sp.]
MAVFLMIALFVATSLAVLVALADSAVRGRNAWKAIRRELAADMASDVPVSDGVVVQMRPAICHGAAPAPTQMPHAVAA